MKELKVIIRDRNTLVLEEPGDVGDIIDLTKISNIDVNTLLKTLSEGKDQVYNNKLVDFKETLNREFKGQVDLLKANFETEKISLKNDLLAQKRKELAELENKIISLTQEKQILEANKEAQIKENKALIEKELLNQFNSKENTYKDAINKLKFENEKELNSLKVDLEKLKEINSSLAEKVKSEYELKLQALQNELNIFKINSKNELELEKQKLEFNHNKHLNELKETYQSELTAKENEINDLKRSKASLNVKQTGEDLEKWCDNEVSQIMQNGLQNCTWVKDNKVVRDEDETRGSKADFIFRVFSDETHQSELTSICFDMKDQNPESIYKLKNEAHYAQLDKNRIKKNCVYAVLVSSLETDQANYLPIYKVSGYKDMYVVRPAYLVTFINMIASLTLKFKDLYLAKAKEEIKFKDKEEILKLVDDIKNTYLDKPLELLKKDIENILDQSAKIKQICTTIDDKCLHIQAKYINDIQNKINKFELNTNKVIKKISKIEE